MKINWKDYSKPANKYILPTPSAVKKIIVGAIKERLSNVKVAQSDNKETN